MLNKVKNLLYYGETVNNELECRFAQHPRFVMWIHYILYRHKTMSQGNIYLQQNEKDKLLTTTPRNVIHRKLRKYPHLVNWFFTQKFKEVLH